MYPCEIKELPARHALCIRFRSPVENLPQHFKDAYGSIMRYLGTLGAEHEGAAFAAYHNLDMRNLDVEAGFPVSSPLPGKGEIRAITIPGGMSAICHYKGPYDGMSAAYTELSAFVAAQGFKISGLTTYEWYLNGPDEVGPQDLRTDIVYSVMPIAEKTAI
ncbi:MAG: GyrI-like domain-containing protein [Anaerolineae bacterium]|nr:GyrI-like domain-containing protein [Anaerolineae bacterium]